MRRPLLSLCLWAAAGVAVANDAADFRRGRELIDLGRLSEAAQVLRQVPADSKLYPYAARGILYCAWQDPQADFKALVEPLTHAADAEIARKAAWALAEHELMAGQVPSVPAETLQQDVAAHPELQTTERLLAIDRLRVAGQTEQALAEERRLEAEGNLSTEMRIRARMALAEIYYAEEAAADPEPDIADDDDSPVEEENTPSIPRGQGEETLLHLIAAHPDTPLLPELFRRLAAHGAFRNGGAALDRLKEWSEDSRKPRRAALALLQLNALQNPEAARELAPDSSFANKALADCPREAETDTLLLEQARLLLRRGETEAAGLYLNRLSEAARQSPQARFLAASAENDPDKRLNAFLELAPRAPQELQRAAWYNAALTALQNGRDDVVSALLESPELTEDCCRELLVLCAEYRMQTAPATSQTVLENLAEQQKLPAEWQREVQLNLAYLYPKEQSEALLRTLNPAELSDSQVIRYYALRERHAADEHEAIELLREGIATVAGREGPETDLSIHLSHVFSAADHHRMALRTLQHLLKRYPKGDRARRALYLAARQAELIGTSEGLNESLELYERCAEGTDTTARHAVIRRANILTRIGRTAEALQLVENLLRSGQEFSATDRALINAARANAHGMEGTPEGTAAALAAVEETLALPDLPPRWRMVSLLYHAGLSARLGHEDDALEDYRKMLKARPEDMSSLSEAAAKDFYIAAAALIYHHLEEEAYEQAAQLAAQAAAWAPDSAFSAAFRDWAEDIRKRHFLPAEE